MRLHFAALASALVLIFPLAGRAAQDGLVDDRAITLHSAADVKKKRGALVKYLWGQPGFPANRLPDVVLTNVPSPVHQLTNLARADEFRFDLTTGLQALAYHFIPAKANGELVVVHHGHGCTLDDAPGPADAGFGLQRTIHA